MDKYELLDQVGEGSYGSVWRAINHQTNQSVAIKIFHTVDDEGLSRSAVQELKFLQMLKSCKGVIPILDSFLCDDNSNRSKLAIVFPFADCDLTGLCDSGPTFKIEEVKCIMKQMIEAMTRVHSFNLIHRDLKSANILFHHGKVYVGDVGMMTQHERNKHHDPSLITRWYRAPELLLGKSNYGTEVDMWSIGCILVEVMTKKTPFPGMNEDHQADCIFKVIGTPTQERWGDEVLSYPGWKKLRHGLYKTNQIRNIFKDWDKNAIDFLERLWSPPNTRITAEEALNHPFFTADPLPCEPSSLPKVAPIHEFEVKKRKNIPQANEQNKRMKPTMTSNGLLPANSYANPSGHIAHGGKTHVQSQRQPVQYRPTNGIAKSLISNQQPPRTILTGQRSNAAVAQ